MCPTQEEMGLKFVLGIVRRMLNMNGKEILTLSMPSNDEETCFLSNIKICKSVLWKVIPLNEVAFVKKRLYYA